MTMTLEPQTDRIPSGLSAKLPAPTEPLHPLTSLRFFGSLAIFFFHAIDFCKRDAQVLIFGSASAVSLFFVLSGFILVYIYQRKLSQLGTWGFYARRIARLWPLHVACLTLILIFQYQVFRYPEITQSGNFWPKLGLHLLMLQNLVPSADWSLSFNGVAWFVGVEFCFCLLFPFLAAGGKQTILRIWTSSLLLLVLALAVANRVLAASPELIENIYNMIQCNPVFRLFEFTSGMLVGYIVIDGARLPGGRYRFVIHAVFEALAIAFLVISLHHGPLAQWLFKFSAEQGWRTTVAWLGKGGSSLPASMFLIWVLASSKGPLAALLSHTLLVYLGKLSYSFYMIHLLVLNLIVGNCPPHQSPTVMILGGLALSIAAATLLNLLVETPWRHWLAGLLDRKQSLIKETSFTAHSTIRTVYSSAVACLVGLLGYWALRSEANRDPLVPPGEPRQIVFNESAILHSVEARRNKDYLELTLIWEKLPKFNGTRFAHIIETPEKLRHLPVNTKLFDSGRIAIERIQISQNELEGATAIGVGILEAGKAVKFTNRTRTFAGWRLTVYDCQRNTVPNAVRENTKLRSDFQR